MRVAWSPGGIAVEDTGPGLTPDELERAFERFFLYSRYGGERAVGTGLGLAIVKELVEGMGGSVDGASVPGAPHALRRAAAGPASAIRPRCRGASRSGLAVLRPTYGRRTAT